MNTSKTEVIDRHHLGRLINEQSIKHTWLASTIKVSEKTLTRWLNGDVTRIRVANLKKLAEALNCQMDSLVAVSEVDSYPSTKNRDILVNELYNDSLLYQLLMNSKIRLAISLIKSTFHSKLPGAIVASFYTKLGYAALFNRKQKTARKYFDRAMARAQSSGSEEETFSVNLALAILHFLDSNFEQCLYNLTCCEERKEHACQEKAHFYNTYALYYLYTGQVERSISYSNLCIDECSPDKASIEKDLFLSTALQLKGAAFLIEGDSDNAIVCCESALLVAKRSGYERCIRLSKAYLAGVSAATGQLDLATQLADESLEKADEQDISMPTLLCAAILVHRHNDDLDSLLDLHKRLCCISPEQSAPFVFSLYQLFKLYQQRGNRSEAVSISQQINTLLDNLKLNAWKIGKSDILLT